MILKSRKWLSKTLSRKEILSFKEKWEDDSEVTIRVKQHYLPGAKEYTYYFLDYVANNRAPNYFGTCATREYCCVNFINSGTFSKLAVDKKSQLSGFWPEVNQITLNTGILGTENSLKCWATRWNDLEVYEKVGFIPNRKMYQDLDAFLMHFNMLGDWEWPKRSKVFQVAIIIILRPGLPVDSVVWIR